MEHSPTPAHGFTAVGAVALAHAALAVGAAGFIWHLLLPVEIVGVMFVIIHLLLLPVFLPLYRRLYPERPFDEG